MTNQQKDTQASRSDTTAPGGARPVQGQSESGKVGADIAGAAGGTDAAAGARMAGGQGPGGAGPRGQEPDAAPPIGTAATAVRDDMLTPGVGAAVAGGTGLGEAASADDTRVGTGSGQAGAPAGGNPSSGDIPPPGDKGGASAA